MSNIILKEGDSPQAGLANKDTATVLAAGSFITVDASGEAIAADDTTADDVAYTVEGAAAGKLSVEFVSSEETVFEADVTTTLTQAHKGLECGLDASGVVDQTNTTDKLFKILSSSDQDKYVGTSKALVRINTGYTL